MRHPTLPSFDDLRRRFAVEDDDFTPPRIDEVAHLLRYLRETGAVVHTAEDVFTAINGREGEEELAAFRCAEGTAVSHASNGWWLLIGSDAELGETPAASRHIAQRGAA